MLKASVSFLSVMVISFVIVSEGAKAQQANFTAPDSVCVGTPVQVNNLTVGASTYSWNFCVSNIDTTPTAINLGGFGGVLDAPVFMSVVQDAGSYYAFVSNNLSGHLVCLKFGPSLLNPAPVVQDLGNCGVIPVTAEGIQVLNVGGMWTAIMVGGNGVSGAPCIVKVDLGPSLAAMKPVGTNWGNIGNLNYPVKLYIFQDLAGLYHGYTVNFQGSTLTRFDFGSSFVNAPVGTNLGNPGGVLNGPTGLFPILDGGNYYLFLPNETGNTLTRLDFGNSLLNPPVAVSLGDPGKVLDGPRDFAMVKFCGKTVGYAVNHYSNDLVKFDFAGGVADDNPAAESLGVLGGMDFPHSISNFFQVGSNIYAFVPNVTSNTVTELIFEGCNNQDIPNSSLQNPPSFTYSVPGTYNISLMTDIGLPTQSSYCQSVTVLPAPVVMLPKDTAFCAGQRITLTVPAYPGAIYQWSTGAGSNSIVIDTTGQFLLHLDDYGCVVSDTVAAASRRVPFAQLPPDTTYCDSALVRIVSFSGVTYSWSTGSDSAGTWVKATGLYKLNLDDSGCVVSDSAFYTVLQTPRFTLGKGRQPLCPGDTLILTPSNDSLTYIWQDGTVDSTEAVTAPGVYFATTSNVCGRYMDTVTVYQGLCTVRVPGGFTPNGDGINDVFKVLGTDGVDQFDLRIWNVWGEKVFEARDRHAAWDGTFKGMPQPSGGFVYQLNYSEQATGDPHQMSGTLLLLR